MASIGRYNNMNISEAMLVSWSQGPGQTEADRCQNAESAVRDAVRSDDELQNLDITVFPQGSYRARTNVRQDSDVDICVRCNNVFFVDYPEGKTDDDYYHFDSELKYADFKNMVERALRNYFSSNGVTRGSKAFDIHENTYRIDADVIPTVEYRWYVDMTRYHSGVGFIPDGGWRVVNWPQQNYDNGVVKNNRTARVFKRVVRIIKRLRYKMDDEGIAQAKNIPSYLVECLVWNAPDSAFNHFTYTADVREVLAHTFNNTLTDEDCKEWGEENDLKYLFRAAQPWTRQQAHSFLSAAWDYIGFE
jgi:hypothetical protein